MVARRRVALVAVAGVCVAAPAIVLAVSSGSSTSAASLPPPLGALRTQILRMATASGDPHPDSMTAVQTTWQRWQALVGGSLADTPGGEPVWVVVARGRFVLYGASFPHGAKPPHGTTLYLVERELGSSIAEQGVGPTDYDLSSLGSPVDLR
jgi:hypothetical protein